MTFTREKHQDNAENGVGQLMAFGDLEGVRDVRVHDVRCDMELQGVAEEHPQ